MSDIQNIEYIVETVLEDFPEARDSDKVCLIQVLKSLDVNTSYSFEYVLMNCGVNFETVRRTRQRLQEKKPELRGVTYQNRYRRKREAEFRDYALGREENGK